MPGWDCPRPRSPGGSLPPFEEQVEVVLRSDVAIFSFTFGIPEARVIEPDERTRNKMIGTATNVAEARALEAAGVDAIVAQGSEAGLIAEPFSARLRTVWSEPWHWYRR